MMLPDGYSKVKEKEIDYVYTVPEYLGGESLKIALETLDEVVSSIFEGMHLLEPRAEVKDVWKVK